MAVMVGLAHSIQFATMNISANNGNIKTCFTVVTLSCLMPPTSTKTKHILDQYYKTDFDA